MVKLSLLSSSTMQVSDNSHVSAYQIGDTCCFSMCIHARMWKHQFSLYTNSLGYKLDIQDFRQPCLSDEVLCISVLHLDTMSYSDGSTNMTLIRVTILFFSLYWKKTKCIQSNCIPVKKKTDCLVIHISSLEPIIFNYKSP